MYRVISLMKRKPELTHTQFRDFYESNQRLVGERAIDGYGLSYDRYYLRPMTADGAEPIYDAVIHRCFLDRSAYDQFTAAARSDLKTERLFMEYNAESLDRSSTVHFEAQDSFSILQQLPAGDSIFRTVWFARHRFDMTHEQSRVYYETKHRLLGEYMINGYAYNYDRHYLYKLAPDAPAPYYTFVMEMNFPSRAILDQVTANIVGDPTLGRLIAEDEARFIDRDSAVHYAAELSASVLQPLK